MTLRDLKQIFHKELDAAYCSQEVTMFFYMCLEYYHNISRVQLSIEPKLTLSKDEIKPLFKALEALKQQKPIQYILGETDFFGLKFKVTPDVLIPRQETEELIDIILKESRNKPLKILDIGTGSGCIAISLAKNLPNADVYALDVSSSALNLARHNAVSNDVNMSFITADILEASSWQLNFNNLKFDIIVSNPPYVRHLEKLEIKPNVLNYEPHLALFVPDDNPLMFYDAILKFSKTHLSIGGMLYFEINQYLGEQTKTLMTDLEFKEIQLIKDLNGNDRILKGKK